MSVRVSVCEWVGGCDLDNSGGAEAETTISEVNNCHRERAAGRLSESRPGVIDW